MCYEVTIKCNHKETITIFPKSIFAIFLFGGGLTLSKSRTGCSFSSNICNVAIILLCKLLCKINIIHFVRNRFLVRFINTENLHLCDQMSGWLRHCQKHGINLV